MTRSLLDTKTIYGNHDKLNPRYTDSMTACLVGGVADIKEKFLTNYSYYSPTETIEIPDRNYSRVLDDKLMSLKAKDAEFLILEDLQGSGGTVSPVAGNPDRLKSSTINFVSNGDLYPRSSVLYDRDVKVGDVAEYRTVVGGNPIIHKSKIVGFVFEKTTPVTGSAVPSANNQPSQGSSSSSNQTAGPTNYVYVQNFDISNYFDYDGGLNRIYKLVVIEGGTTNAKFRLISSDGLDDDNEVTGIQFGVAAPLGSKGATVTFNLDNSRTVSPPDTPTSVFVPGQEFTFVIQKNYTAPTATSSGVHTSDVDRSLIVRVDKGNLFHPTNGPKISVMSSDGSHFVKSINVPSAGAPISIGYGVTISFTGTNGLIKNDSWSISLTAPKPTTANTIILADPLPNAAMSASDGDLKIFLVKKEVNIPRKSQIGPGDNWSNTSTSVTVSTNIAMPLEDGPSYSSGEKVPLPLISAKMYLKYREWVNDNTGKILDVNNGNLVSTLGPVVPENPLSYAASKFMEASGGKGVKVLSISDPGDKESWLSSLNILSRDSSFYNVVPLTTNKDVIKKFVEHAVSMSSTENQKWRRVIADFKVRSTKVLLDKSNTNDNNDPTFTVVDNPVISGTQFTYVICNSNNAGLLSKDVRPGDYLQLGRASDINEDKSHLEELPEDADKETYVMEFKIASVINNNILLLEKGPDVGITTPVVGRIVRKMSNEETAYSMILQLSPDLGLSSDRLSLVVSGDYYIDSNGVEVKRQFLSPIVAGLQCRSAPHQPLGSAQIPGLSEVPVVSKFFGNQLSELLSGSGFVVIGSDYNQSGYKVAFIHKLVSTNVSSLETKEVSYISNVDIVKHVILKFVEKHIGKVNLYGSDSAGVGSLYSLRLDLESAVRAIQTETEVAGLGAMLKHGEVREIRPHAVSPDTAVVSLKLEFLFPLNTVQLLLI